jgi:hypothetical protein
MKLLEKNPDCELMGYKLKSLFNERDVDKAGGLLFQMPNGEEKRFIDLVGPSRRHVEERSMLPQPA